MTDAPIIFSGPMVKALLSGRKTMTRRLATSPLRNVKVGDRLWVREAHAFTSWDEDGQFIVDYLADDARSKWLSPDDGDVAQGLMERLCSQFDRAGIKLGPAGNYEKPARRFGKPSIHMPRWAARLTLVVTAVKTERLQEMSEADAIAEGVSRIGSDIPWAVDSFKTGPNFYTIDMGDGALNQPTAAGTFALLWKVLHGEESWDANPEVVAISFDVVKANIDAAEARAAA